MLKLVVEIEYQKGLARDIAADDVRRALVAFVPHEIISVKEVALKMVTCPKCKTVFGVEFPAPQSG